MVTKIKRESLYPLKTVLSKLEDYFTGDISVDLAYYASKNIDKLEEEIKLIEGNELLKSPESFVAYENARMELLGKYAEHDEGGQIILNPGTNEAKLTDKNKKKFESEFEKLRASNAEAIKENDVVMGKKHEFMQGYSEVELFPFSRKLLPSIKARENASGWAVQLFSLLSPIISED